MKKFQKRGVYEGELFLFLSEGKHFSRLGISSDKHQQTSKKFLGSLSDYSLSDLVDEKNVLSCEFFNIGFDSKSIVNNFNFLSMLGNRLVIEFNKINPFPFLKNFFYSLIGVNFGDGLKKVTVAPYVYLDFILPELIEIGDGSIIGESAFIQTHFFNPDRLVIGRVIIGDNCSVGSGVRVLPGSVIEDNVVLGVDSTINGFVRKGSRIKPNIFYESF